jgi:hypothetical protein
VETVTEEISESEEVEEVEESDFEPDFVFDPTKYIGGY